MVCGAQTGPDILHWKLDEGEGAIAADSTGQGRDGVIASTNTWTNGVSGSALHFGGAGDQVLDAYADEYLNGLTAITVAVWINSEEIASDRGFLSAAGPPVAPSGVDGPLTLQYASVGPVGGGADVLTVAIDTTGGRLFVESSSNIQTTDWQHVAFTWSAGEPIRLYIDGQPDATAWNGLLPPFPNSTHPVGSIVNIENLLLGQGPGTNSWLGGVDDFRIYGRVLSDTEVASIALGEANLSVRLSIDDPAPEQGSNVTYHVAVENLGPHAAENVEVVEMFSSNQLSFASAIPGAGTYDATTHVWAFDNLLVGETQTLDLVFSVLATNPCEISNSVSVVAENEDPGLGNNTFALFSPDQDVLEPDNTPGDATYLHFVNTTTNLHYDLNFHTPDDEDWFEVEWMKSTLFVSVAPVSTNLDIQIEVYHPETNGTYTLINVIDFNGVGSSETAELFKTGGSGPPLPGPPYPGNMFFRIVPGPATAWNEQCPLFYTIDMIKVGSAAAFIAIATDWLNTLPGHPNVPPPGLQSSIGNFDGNGVMFRQGSNGQFESLTVGAAAGYLPAESSVLSGQVGNPFNSNFGNPRWVQHTISINTYGFTFVPTVTLDGEIRDAGTQAPIEGASLSFEATSGRIAGSRFDGHPEGAWYESDWLTDSNGDFPDNVKLPTVNYTLTVSKTGYQTKVIPNAVLNPNPGDPMTVAGSPILISPLQVLTISPEGEVDFGTIAVGSSVERTVAVSNTGDGTLDGSAAVGDLGVPSPFGIVSGGAYSLGAGQTQEVSICYSPTAPATDVWNIRFTGQSGTEWRTVRGRALGNTDSDGDGVGDWPEYIAGTSWTNSDDFLHLKSAGIVPGTNDFEACWDSVTGRVYTLEGALAPGGPWTQILQTVGSATQECHSVPTSAGDEQHLRLDVHLAE
jgi:uncharacterized repeat protein (TIGR01451 family)